MGKIIILSVAALILTACGTEPSSNPPADLEVLDVIPQNTIGYDANPRQDSMAIDVAKERCKAEGKEILVIDTRTAGEEGVGSLSYGDLRYLCLPK